MKTIYTKEQCPACVRLKERLKQDGEEYKEVMIGRDISREDFMTQYPTIRSVPYILETDANPM
jgi:glutaredoxin